MMLEPHQIQKAAHAVEAVASIDKLIEWLGRDVDTDAGTWGCGIRKVLGQNRMSKLTNERIGHIAFTGIINELLREREMLVAEYGDVVRFPDAPCPVQEIPDPA
jgi:hypothetical protein